ncbi:hypothetical protein ACFLWF_00645 [Chloroflexota bacterium]
MIDGTIAGWGGSTERDVWIQYIGDYNNSVISFIDQILVLLRIVMVLVLVFFLPGFAWTLIFFKQITRIERLIMSFGLSIALTTLGIVFSNVILNINLTGMNALLIIILITIVPLAIFFGGRYFPPRPQIREKTDT